MTQINLEDNHGFADQLATNPAEGLPGLSRGRTRGRLRRTGLFALRRRDAGGQDRIHRPVLDAGPLHRAGQEVADGSADGLRQVPAVGKRPVDEDRNHGHDRRDAVLPAVRLQKPFPGSARLHRCLFFAHLRHLFGQSSAGRCGRPGRAPVLRLRRPHPGFVHSGQLPGLPSARHLRDPRLAAPFDRTGRPRSVPEKVSETHQGGVQWHVTST